MLNTNIPFGHNLFCNTKNYWTMNNNNTNVYLSILAFVRLYIIIFRFIH